MGNMSYCRFENTLGDLKDCSYNMGEELSDTEFKAREEMIALCESIVEEYGDTSFEEGEKE